MGRKGMSGNLQSIPTFYLSSFDQKTTHKYNNMFVSCTFLAEKHMAVVLSEFSKDVFYKTFLCFLALLPKQHISVGQSNETVILSYEQEVVALENWIVVPILYSILHG